MRSGPSGLIAQPRNSQLSRAAADRLAGSIFTPGPMVEETATRFMKVPLAPDGLAFMHRIGEGADVLDQRLLGEARLADAGLDDAGLLDAELDRAALGRADRAGRHPW